VDAARVRLVFAPASERRRKPAKLVAVSVAAEQLLRQLPRLRPQLLLRAVRALHLLTVARHSTPQVSRTLGTAPAISSSVANASLPRTARAAAAPDRPESARVLARRRKPARPAVVLSPSALSDADWLLFCNRVSGKLGLIE